MVNSTTESKRAAKLAATADVEAGKPVEGKLAGDEKQPYKWPRFTWWRRAIFLDVEGLVRRGYRTRLEPEDMYAEPTVNTARLVERFQPALEAIKAKQPDDGPPDLKRVVLAGNVGLLVFTGILYLIGQALSLAGPLLLQRIVRGLTCRGAQEQFPQLQCEPKSTMYYYCIGLFLAPLIQSFCDNHQMFLLYLTGTRMRNALMAAIYRKCLRLSNSSLQEESTGRVVTLMSNDAQKLQDAMMAIHALWGSPCYIIAILVLLWFQVGWATFVGLAIMLLLGPLSGTLAAKLGRFRRETLKYTDKRVGYMNEVITGIQMIKFYAWEVPFTAKVMEARDGEARMLRRTAFWQGIFGVVLFSGPVLVAIFCFGAWTLAGNKLTNASAYTALALFSLLRFPMSFLPMLITMVVNALIALKRIGGFLQRSESELSKEVFSGNHPVGSVDITDGEFAWDDKIEKSTLTGIQLHARPGTLTMIVGGVGSGKSSVLGALVGHISKRAGSVGVGGRVAYVSQTAWIMNETLQDNVLMGEELVADKYRHALEVSQLGPDLAILPNGDLTEIGDRGITLSGGQKQRVSIARAVYSEADVYLLDDPLSAVDSHVGRALFEQCIQGVLRNKTVVLVTNALQYLPQADHVVWMDGGAIKAQGKYSELVQEGLNIAELMNYGEDDDEDDDSQQGDGDQGAAEHDKRAAIVADGTVVAAAPAGPVADVGPAAAIASSHAASMDQTAANGMNRASSAGNAEKSGGSLTKRRSREKKRVGFVQADTPMKDAEGVRADMAGPAVTKIAGHKPYLATQGSGVGISLARSKTMNKNLTGVEERESGNISWSVVKMYFSNGGGLFVFLSLLLLYGLEQGARVYTDRWVGVWASDTYQQSIAFYLGLYFAFGIIYGALTFLRTLDFLFMCVRAAVSIHNKLLGHILRLPKTFFDTNPAGRILNRFSRDTDIMDGTLSASLIQFTGAVATYISILIVISIATKWFAVALPPLTLFYFLLQRYYIPTARELQRIESVSRSPIYSKFGEALLGVPTIRAYRKEAHFTQVNDELMEGNARAYVTQKLCSSWLAMRLDLVGLVVLTGCGVLVIAGNVDPALAGLALTYALDLTRFLKHGTNMAAKSEADFNSVERIAQYLRPEPEAAPETAPEVAKTLPAEWPAQGAISVRDLTMRYRPHLPLVLRGVSFEVTGGERVGLVGRTGSGKSSILLALFRMVEAHSGAIYIDGVNIATLGVRHLRSKMSIIPQDPFMFSGTVRANLDPFQLHDDARLWEVLDAVGLKLVISGLPDKLSAKVVDNGANFSLGQRQLFCMARAMLRRSKLLMLDEATASVDLDTDNLLQAAIRTAFAGCTMLTIAHRLNTIMDSDKVVVLDHGLVVEDGHPHQLLANGKGAFTSMVAQTGKASARYLRGLASNQWEVAEGMKRVAGSSTSLAITSEQDSSHTEISSSSSSDDGYGGDGRSAGSSVPSSGALAPSTVAVNSRGSVAGDSNLTPRLSEVGSAEAQAVLHTPHTSAQQAVVTVMGGGPVAVEAASAAALAAAAAVEAGQASSTDK